MRTLVTTLTTLFALVAPALSQDKATPIEATDIDAIKAAIGKNITVSGTLKQLLNADKKKPVTLKFVDSELKVWATAANYWKAGGWGLEAYVDKTMYIHGKVAKRSSTDGVKIELLGEAYFHEDLDALLSSLPKPKSDGKPAEPKKYEPVSSGAVLPRNHGPKNLIPTNDSASVKVILPKFGGPQPEMIVTEVSAEIIDEEEAGPMQATFELKPKLGIDPMINVMSFLPKKYKAEGWPMNKTAHFIIDEIQADSAPPNFAAAVLIDAMLSGVDIPENVILFSALDKNGKITRSGDQKRSNASYIDAIKLAASAAFPPVEEEDEDDEKKKKKSRSAFGDKAPKPEKTMYLITGNIPDPTLDDIIIDQDWDTLNSTIVLRCATHQDAMDMIRAIGSGDALGKSITDLAEAQALMRDKSIRMLANPAVWSRVVAAGKASKDNITAFGYARMKARKVSETYSLDRCLGHIGGMVSKGRDPGLDKFSERDLRKHMRDIATEMKQIEGKIHPAATPVLEAGLKFLDAIQGRAAALKKAKSKVKDQKDAKVPERDQAKYQAAKTAYEEAVAAARKAAK